MARLLTEDDYAFLPVAEAVSPAKTGFFQHWVDAWWIIHPDKGLAFYRRGRRGLGAPQCNTSEQIARMVLGSAPPPWEGAEVRKIASAWVPIDIDDYRS
jgi:hypothetical protein